MFEVGSHVKLLAPIAGYAPGTTAVVVAVPDAGTCEVELASGKRFLLGTTALSLIQHQRLAHPSPATI
ncbi:MAG: hypothetical protein ACJ77E_17870 [Gaiellaceae bacterium]